MTDLAHVFLTRYNLPTPGPEALVRAREGWLRDRTELFERYAVSSMRRQRALLPEAQWPTWIVYVDPLSPTWLLETLRALEVEGLLTPVLRESVAPDHLIADIRGVTGRRHGRLLTTNLDNDDGLSDDFSLRLRRAAEHVGTRSALYVTTGLVATRSALFLRHDRQNAFCSVVEGAQEPVTCWVDWHNRLSHHMPVRHVAGPPGWLQVIHDSNVSNRPRGRLVSPRRYRPAFGDMIDLIPDPTIAAIITDAVRDAPMRAIRDRGRAALRVLIVGALGKDTYNDLKARLARSRS